MTERRRPSPLDPLVRKVEAASALDGPAKAAAKQVRGALAGGALKEAVSGTWLGHAVHPMLTDVVIGSWVSATLLDVLGDSGDARARAAHRHRHRRLRPHRA